MLNTLWLAMVALALVLGAATGRLDAVAQACTESARQAATLVLGLWGPMALWLGLVRILADAKVMAAITAPFARLFRYLMPEVPAGHPALALMSLNMASNVLGLGNAATPMGLKAMQSLAGLHKSPHASNPMVLFLVLNTSGLAVLPTGMIALRASLGSHAPAAIFLPTVLATFTAAVFGVLAAKLLERFYPVPSGAATASASAAEVDPAHAACAGAAAAPRRAEKEDLALAEAAVAEAGGPAAQPALGVAALAVVLGSLAYGCVQLHEQSGAGWGEVVHRAVAQWSLLLLMGGFIAVGVLRGVRVYDSVVAGGKEAFEVLVALVPPLVAILVAIGMVRAAGAIDAVTHALGPYTAQVGLPAPALPMVLLRPLSGSGAYAVAADIMRAEGPDSLCGLIVSTLMGTTETTFYVLALYLGAGGIRNGRHALVSCLCADAAGTAMAVAACHWALG